MEEELPRHDRRFWQGHFSVLRHKHFPFPPVSFPRPERRSRQRCWWRRLLRPRSQSRHLAKQTRIHRRNDDPPVLFTEAKFTARRPHFGSFHSDENFAFQIYARNKQMQDLPFYGLGPDTNVHNAVQFSERDTRFGALVASPLTSWLSASGTFETLWPDIGNVDSSKVISIGQAYTEQTAPGLASQPTFLHFEAFLRPHFSLASEHLQFDYRFRYGYFHDTDTGHYSFRRFVADFGHSLYPESENGHRRIDSVFTVRFRLSMSDASASNAVPFYLQETIGGSDIDNQATLRSFR